MLSTVGPSSNPWYSAKPKLRLPWVAKRPTAHALGQIPCTYKFYRGLSFRYVVLLRKPQSMSLAYHSVATNSAQSLPNLARRHTLQPQSAQGLCRRFCPFHTFTFTLNHLVPYMHTHAIVGIYPILNYQNSCITLSSQNNTVSSKTVMAEASK